MNKVRIAVLPTKMAVIIDWPEALDELMTTEIDCVGVELCDVFSIVDGTIIPSESGVYDMTFTIVMVGETWESIIQSEPTYHNFQFEKVNYAA